MVLFYRLAEAVFTIVIIYALAIIMRWRGVLKEEHSVILSRVITDLCLPAIIFVSLAGKSIRFDQLAPAILMLSNELIFIGISWLIGILLGFSKDKQGAIVFCSTFGSSTFLGYSIIMEMYPDRAGALAEAVLISEIGVGYPIFILGPILAAYFGAAKSRPKWSSSLVFFRSPVFFSLIIGFLWGFFHLPRENNVFMIPVFRVCHILASALIPLAVLSVGLMFKMPKIRQILLPLGIVVLLKLLFKPLLIGSFASLLNFPKMWKDILIVLAAMPPALLGVVFIRRYGGSASLASALLLNATLISCVSILGVFWFIG